MINDLIANLTLEQKHALDAVGIKANSRSDWRHGRRSPTSAQLLALASVLQIDPGPLLLWHAQQEATPAQLDLFRSYAARQALKAAAGAAVSLSVGASQAFALYPSALSADQAHSANMHIVANLYSAKALTTR